VQSDWQTIGNVELQELKASRMQLHSAVQLAAALGKVFAHPEPDDSHGSLQWDALRKAFVGAKIDQPPAQALLEVVTLTLSISGAGVVRNLGLHGHTLAEGFDWLRMTLKDQGAAPERLDQIGDRSQLPDGVFGETDKFDGSLGAGFSEWARHYGNAQLLLREVKAKQPGFSAIRVWPHHFDIASLYSLQREKDEQRTIGVGLSPGDSSYDEPYWYVTPWPYPDARNLGPLDGDGIWHTQKWVGAVLPVSRIPRNGGEKQPAQVRRFLQSAIEICARVLQVSFRNE
jgi:hypothetical protein